MTQNEFIQKSILKHLDKYDYTLVEYINNSTRVKIICKIHGKFEQIPKDHMKGCGCKKCGLIKQGLSGRTKQEEFINKANLIHSFKYDYSKVEYIKNSIKIIVICSKHGEFEVTPNDHLNKESGCKKCTESKGERIIREWLELNNILYIKEFRFDDCRDIRPLPFDFYIPDFNLLIEYDGYQHYKPFSWNRDRSDKTMLKNLEDTKKKDKIRNNYTKENNINILRIPYWKINNISTILKERLQIR